ncbi:MAG: hypothetical protein Q8R02_21400 [Hyphomonadaceae bacterium]|nr:hypothetical protein [Hyphomonadaceae bacterium]
MSRKGPEKPPKPATNADRRQKRLAEALRANLKRRKAVRQNPGKDTLGKPDGGED